MNAAKGKNLSPAALTVLRLVLFLVVALLLPKTRVWGFEAAPQHASGKIAFASASATGEIALALAYDASGCPVTLNSGAGDGITFSNQTVDGPLGNSGITTVAKDSPTELPQPSGAGDYQPDQSLLQEFTGENMGPTTPEDYNVQIGSPEEEDAAESAFINNVPGLGLAKNSIEAITGNDLITGKPIDPNTAFENILNGAVTTTLTLGGGPEAGGESELMGVADTTTAAGSSEIVPYSGQVTPTGWPSNGGFLGAASETELPVGTLVDRYGVDGSYVSPVGTPFSGRGLPASSASLPLNTFEVVSPINVQSGLASPAFGQPGLGLQFKFPFTVEELIDLGVLKRR
jgi:hypothetical protein